MDSKVTKSTKPRKSAFLIALAVGLAVMLMGASSASAGTRGDRADRIQNYKMEKTAYKVVKDLARGRTGIIDRAFQPDFVDHASGETGTAALRKAVEAQADAYPKSKTRIYRVVSEGDLVFVHANLKLERKTLGFATADIYRFEDGRIAEHWGGIQAVPETTASGNDMFSTLSSPRQLRPDRRADVNETKAVIGELGAALVVDRDLTAWDRLVAPPYYQHSVNTPNGAEAVKEIWGALLVDPSISVSFVNGLSEGDLSVSQNRIEGPGLNLLTFDISRVRDGKIVEHWDIVQALP